MTIYKPELVSGDKIPMAVTNPRHLVPSTGPYQAKGAALAELGSKIGAEAVLRSGSFEDTKGPGLGKCGPESLIGTYGNHGDGS